MAFGAKLQCEWGIHISGEGQRGDYCAASPLLEEVTLSSAALPARLRPPAPAEAFAGAGLYRGRAYAARSARAAAVLGGAGALLAGAGSLGRSGGAALLTVEQGTAMTRLPPPPGECSGMPLQSVISNK